MRDVHFVRFKVGKLFGFLFGGFSFRSNLGSYLWPKLQNLNRNSFENVVCGYASPRLSPECECIKSNKAFSRTLNIKITFSSELWAARWLLRKVWGSISRKLRGNCWKESPFSFQVVTKMSPKCAPLSHRSNLISQQSNLLLFEEEKITYLCV